MLPPRRKIDRLVRRIQAGTRREESAAELYRLLHPRVESLFRHRGFDDDECRDLTQEVFLRVYAGIEGYAGQAPFTSWLQAIALNVYRNEIRRRRAARRDQVAISIEGGSSGERQDDSLEIAAAEPSPFDRRVDRERHEKVRAVVAAMPAQMRTCFRLRYDHGYKYREIADLMKISIQTVRAHLYQARQRLLAELSLDFGEEPEEE